MSANLSPGILASLSGALDLITGVEGSLGYFLIVSLFFVGYKWLDSTRAIAATAKQQGHATGPPDDDEPEPPRNFTAAQLRKFNGADDNPLYLSVNGTVFDVSSAKDFYGPGGPYEVFAGRECGVALARMSFDEADLDDLAGCATLNAGEKYELENWVEKFTHYRGYPVMGRLVPNDKIPSSERVLSKDDLAANDGTGDFLPEGYAAAPIYLGVGDKVFDVSFGGITFYGAGCSYNRFAGKDASRALAKMSFDPADTENTDTSDLTEDQKKVLADWSRKYETDNLYPVVGRLQK